MTDLSFDIFFVTFPKRQLKPTSSFHQIKVLFALTTFNQLQLERVTRLNYNWTIQ